jgi:nucleoside-diphosphate-sugar epimerase
MSRVMVSGAAGFVGAAAVRALLEQGDDIIALVHHETSSERLSGFPIKTVSLELEDRSAVEQILAEFRPEIILHAAWYVNPKDYLTSPRAISSLRATTDFVQTAVKFGCRRFVGVGTCLEYRTTDHPRHEEDPCEPRTLYASSKLSAWLLSRALVAHSETSLAWARLFYLYGPDENPGRLLPTLVGALRAGKAFPMTAGEQVRDYLHIDDAGRALAMICHQSLNGVFNVGSGSPTVLRDFVLATASMLGAQSLVHVGELPTRPDEEMFVVADMAKLQQLGFKPRHTNLEDGLDDALTHWTAA